MNSGFFNPDQQPENERSAWLEEMQCELHALMEKYRRIAIAEGNAEDHVEVQFLALFIFYSVYCTANGNQQICLSVLLSSLDRFKPGWKRNQ